MPYRLQVATYDRLVAEVIVETSEEASDIYAAFTRAKYCKRQTVGGAVIRHVDMPRVWDVPVGAKL